MIRSCRVVFAVAAFAAVIGLSGCAKLSPEVRRALSLCFAPVGVEGGPYVVQADTDTSQLRLYLKEGTKFDSTKPAGEAVNVEAPTLVLGAGTLLAKTPDGDVALLPPVEMTTAGTLSVVPAEKPDASTGTLARRLEVAVPDLGKGIDVTLVGKAKGHRIFGGPESSVRYGTFWPAGVVVHIGKLATPPTTEELTACVIDASEANYPFSFAKVTEVQSETGQPTTISVVMPESAIEATLNPVQAFVVGLLNANGQMVGYGLVEYVTPGWAAVLSLLAVILIFPIFGVNLSLPRGQKASLGARVLLKPMYRGADGYLSISLLQITLWTVVASWAIAFVFLRSYNLLSMTPEVMGLLGFAGATAVMARIIAGRRRPFKRDEEGNIVPAKTSLAEAMPSRREARRLKRLQRQKNRAKVRPGDQKVAAPAKPRKDRWRRSDWASLVSGQDGFDLVKFQLLLFTVLIAAYVVYRVFKEGAFPTLSPEFLLLMGVSNSVYLANKFADPSQLDTFEALTIRKEEIGEEIRILVDRKAELAKQVDAIEKDATASDALKKEKDDAAARIETIAAELEELEKEREKVVTDLTAINDILSGKEPS